MSPMKSELSETALLTAETEYAGRYWENYREHSGRIKELKDRCEQAGHSLIIALEGKAGTRRRLFKNARDARRAAKYKNEEEAVAGAVSAAPEMWVYQLTDSGLALELTL